MNGLRLLAAVSSLLFALTASAVTYYVSPSGNNTDGLSTATAFHTIQQAADIVNPGDIVLVRAGTYTNAPNSNVVTITRSGTPSAWITFKNYPGEVPKIRFSWWTGIKISGSASYIEINGFEIQGNNDSVTLAQAELQGCTPNPAMNGSGIDVDGRNSGTAKPHHLRFLNNIVYDCGGGGIAIIQADYVTIADNEIFDNAWYSIYANSGLSLYQSWNFDSNSGHRMFITGNRMYNNKSLVRWCSTGNYSDGNGLILDDGNQTQNGSNLSPYSGRTLVANNVSFNNGGSGMHAYEHQNVDFVNNTTYNNGTVVNYPEMFATDSDGCRFINNIAYAKPGAGPTPLSAATSPFRTISSITVRWAFSGHRICTKIRIS